MESSEIRSRSIHAKGLIKIIFGHKIFICELIFKNVSKGSSFFATFFRTFRMQKDDSVR